MSCNCNEDHHHHHHDCDFNCVSNVVRFIHELQECATTTCVWLRSSLLAHNSASVANTRPFILYTKAGTPFEAFAPIGNLDFCTSPIFRVESIDDDDCAVLRVLGVVLGDGSPVPPGPAGANPICTF